MKYRRNIDVPFSISPHAEEDRYSQIFLQRYYAGKLDREVLRLLAILDVRPAIEVLQEIESEDDIRKTIQLERIDALSLAKTHPRFLKNISLSAAKTIFRQLPEIFHSMDLAILIPLAAIMTVVARAGDYVERFEEESAWPVSVEDLFDECYRVAEELREALLSLDIMIPGLVGMELAVYRTVIKLGDDIHRILTTACATKICNCGKDHREEQHLAEYDLLTSCIHLSNHLGIYPQLRSRLVQAIYRELGVLG